MPDDIEKQLGGFHSNIELLRLLMKVAIREKLRCDFIKHLVLATELAKIDRLMVHSGRGEENG